MFKFLRVPAFTKLFDGRTTQSTDASDGTQVHSDVQYVPLAPEAEAEVERLQEEMGFDDQYEKPEGRTGDALAQVVAIASIGVFFLTTWIMTFSSGASFRWFAWHPILQSSCIALFTYGILTLQPTSQPRTKAAGLVRHQLAMIVLGAPVALFGFLAVFYNKVLHDRPHFTTWHGIFGLITMSILVAQIILGGGTVWFNGRLFGGNPRAKFVWKYHRAVGYVTFLTLLLTAHLGGAWSDWSKEHSAYIPRIFAYTLAPACLIAAVYSRVRLSKMNFF